MEMLQRMNTEFCEQKRYLKTGDRTKNIKIPKFKYWAKGIYELT